MARSFNGSSDRIDYSSVMDVTEQPQSISVWLNLDTIVTNQYLWCAHRSTDDVGTFLWLDYDAKDDWYAKFSVSCLTGNLTRQSTIAPFSTGSLVNIIATWDGGLSGSNIHVYVNGVNVDGAYGDGAFPYTCSGRWSLGGRYLDNLRNLDGTLSDVGWWNRVITADEIAMLADGFSPLFIPNSLKFAPDLIRSQRDPISGQAGTLDGTTVADHPRMIYPSDIQFNVTTYNDVTVSPSALNLQLTLLAPVVANTVDIIATSFNLELTLQASTVSTLALLVVVPSTLNLQLVLPVPTIQAEIHTAVSPAALSLELTLLTPAAGGITNITVSPSVLNLVLDLLTPIMSSSTVSFSVTTLTLYVNLRSPIAGVFFPTLSTAPKIEGFTDEYDNAASIIDFYESGRPFINPQYTFNSKDYRFILRYVSQADKETIEAFYVANKSNTFFWLNEQDNTNYAVIFTSRPRCELDTEKEKWKLEFALHRIV